MIILLTGQIDTCFLAELGIKCMICYITHKLTHDWSHRGGNVNNYRQHPLIMIRGLKARRCSTNTLPPVSISK